MEGDLDEEESRVDAHQLPVPVVQMALKRDKGKHDESGATRPDPAEPAPAGEPALALWLFLALHHVWNHHPAGQRRQVTTGGALPALCTWCFSAPTSRRHEPPLCPTHPQVSCFSDVAAVPLTVLEDLGTKSGGMWHGGAGTALDECPPACLGEKDGSGALCYSSFGRRRSSPSTASGGWGFAWRGFKYAG